MGCLFKKFQFALPRGERRQRLRQGQHRCPRFNSRSRVGSDGYLAFMPLYLLMFQFALPRGERRFRQIRRRHDCRFNSRSRVGSDKIHPPPNPAHPVSIRAPAWGATRSVHHPAQLRLGFNSRSRVGSDVDGARFFRCLVVSIRAPAWGATAIPRTGKR